MTRIHTVVCFLGLGVAIATAVLLGVPWGTLIFVLALLACPTAMYLGMRQMARRPGAAARSSAQESRSREGHAGETRQPR